MTLIYGNIDGVKKFILDELEEIYNVKVARDEIATEEIITKIHRLTLALGREISIAIDRKGNVKYVCIGDSTSVDMPIIDIKERRLSGIRIIHTHPNGISRLSALDTSALIRLKLDCVAALSVEEGKTPLITIGFCDIADDRLTFSLTDELTIEEAISYKFLDKIKAIESF